MKRRFSSMMIAAAAGILALTGCSGGNSNTAEPGGSAQPAGQTVSSSTPDAGGNLRIIWWGNQERHDLTSKVLDLYAKTHPGTTFAPEYQGFDGYFQKLTLLAASNNMPDVVNFYVGSSDSNQFLDKGLLEPMDQYVENGTIDVADIGENTLSGGRGADGKLYGIPLGVNARVMIVDPAAYEKAGLTIPGQGYANWEALHDDLAKLKEVTGAYGADDLFNINFTLAYYARQFGQTIAAEEKGIGFDEKLYTDFFTYRQGWSKEGLIPKMDASLSVKNPEESFLVKGQSAVMVAYTNQYPGIVKAAGRPLQMILMPGPDSDKAMDVRPGMHFSISVNSTHKEAAAKFISYFVNDVEANKILNANRGMPVSSAVRAALMEQFEPEMKAVADYMEVVAEHSGPLDPPAPAGATEIDKLMVDLEQQIMYEQTSIKDAYAKLTQEAAAIVARNKQ
ncbi:ABC transporter substrate-binding protein [Paenibacillus sp. FSL R7-0331]|uniref:ABC transporter substrate-binding protein n=1 Tax=Paenibacillus sp. FSL R7-0331 TaxID=1536773 RepID=UPI000693B3FF|nr:extracellular solute-binding protein [Paenibacillus sp. FSL R7-0331]